MRGGDALDRDVDDDTVCSMRMHVVNRRVKHWIAWKMRILVKSGWDRQKV